MFLFLLPTVVKNQTGSEFTGHSGSPKGGSLYTNGSVSRKSSAPHRRGYTNQYMAGKGQHLHSQTHTTLGYNIILLSLHYFTFCGSIETVSLKGGRDERLRRPGGVVLLY